VRRRDFIRGIAASAIWPVAARAQRAAMPVIGFISSVSAPPMELRLTAFREGLSEKGYVEGQNLAIEYRWAEGQYAKLPAMADDLIRRKVTVIVAGGSNAPALAAKAATNTIPIVFSTGADPVGAGLVSSLNRPGGNVTGAFALVAALEGKRLGIVREIVPNAKQIAVLLNPANPGFGSQLNDIQEAARAVDQQLLILRVSTEQDIDPAFASAAQSGVEAMMVGADPAYTIWRDRLVTLAARYSIPAIFELREFATAGGLMSYGTSFTDVYHQVGVYTGRVLKGEKPSDLPVIQSTKVEFVINLKTARALGLTIPSGMLAIADEVIE
jgi:putative tryptophan/tyrosine transport system substrate-binding protein